MGQYACIKNGKTMNVVESLPENVSSFSGKYDVVIEVTGQGVSPGMLYDGHSFSDDPQMQQEQEAKDARLNALKNLSSDASTDSVRDALLALLVELDYQ